MSDSNRSPIPNATVKSEERWNYEATVAQIEAIVDRVESGQLELAAVFDEFATAIQYLRQCETFLVQRQEQMNVLIETLDDVGFEF